MADIYNPFQRKKPGEADRQGGVISAQSGQEQTVGGSQIQNKPTQSRFANLQSFVKANQPQAGQQSMAGQIGETIRKQKEAQASMITGQGGAQSQLQSAASAEEQRLGKGEADPFAVVRAGIAAGQIGSADVGKFQQLASGQTQVPTVSNLQQIQQQTEALKARTAQAQSEQGRFGLLSETFRRPGYSTGQQRLDQLLLQSSPEALRQLQTQAKTASTEAEAQLAGLTELQSRLGGELGALAAQRKSEAEALLTGERAKSPDLESRVKDISGKEQERASFFDQLMNAAAQAGQKSYGSTAQVVDDVFDQQLTEGISSGKISQNEASEIADTRAALKALGFSDVEATQRAAEGLQYKAAEGLTQTGVMSEAEARRENVLRQLAGQTDLIRPEDVGQYKTGEVKFSAEDLKGQLQEARDKLYQEQFSATQAREATERTQQAVQSIADIDKQIQSLNPEDPNYGPNRQQLILQRNEMFNKLVPEYGEKHRNLLQMLQYTGQQYTPQMREQDIISAEQTIIDPYTGQYKAGEGTAGALRERQARLAQVKAQEDALKKRWETVEKLFKRRTN